MYTHIHAHTRTQMHTDTHTQTHMYIQTCFYKDTYKRVRMRLESYLVLVSERLISLCMHVRMYISCMGWLRLVGALKLFVSFAKEPYK